MNDTPFMRSWYRVHGIEGSEIHHHPSDAGGRTGYAGITEAKAKAHGYELEELTPEIAIAIGKSDFWDIINLDQVAKISYRIADELFECGYNMGSGVAARFLQRSLNGLNRQQRDYDDLIVDGLLWTMTIKALREFCEFRGRDGEAVLYELLNNLQGARYLQLTDAREVNEDFLFGWIKQRVLKRLP